MRRVFRRTLITAVLVAPCHAVADADAPGTVPVGAAKVDITPRHPVHLIDQLDAKESANVAQRLWARALAVGSDADGPAVLVSFDGVGVPRAVADEVARRLQDRAGLQRANVAVCATHDHCAPHLSEMLPTIFGGPLPAEHQQHVDQYTEWLTDRLERAARQALADRQPRRLARGVGEVAFAVNRRQVENGHYVGFGDNPDGPVDHRLPVLAVREPDGRLRAVLLSYACHNTAVTVREFGNRMHGDWAGTALARIEAQHPGCVALFANGCGADARPKKRGGFDVAEQHGRTIAREVERLLQTELTPIHGSPACRFRRIELPLEDRPDRRQLEQYIAAAGPDASRPARARGYLARRMLERLGRGEEPPATLPYPVQTWTFGDDLAIVFLGGEVVVDYVLRLRRELDARRLWVLAYANAVPCYIPSKRVLEEGGYEADRSMAYYGLLRRLRPETEDRIVSTVKALLPAAFVGMK